MNSNLPIVTVTLNPAIDQTLSIPNFAAGKVNRVDTSDSYPGGKGVNVAMLLSDLGERVVVTGFLGERNPELFEATFEEMEIDDQFVRVPGETRTSLKIIDPSTQETTDINFPGLAPASTDVALLLDRVNALASADRWFVLSGSIPSGVERDLYARLIELIHGKGGRVALDTSGPALTSAIAWQPDIVKPNVHELSELVGRPLTNSTEIVEAARITLLEKGVKLAVISMGGDGAIFIDGEQALLARPPKVKVVSTVGAGDSMVAGLVYAQQHHLPLEECVRLATALGTHAVTRVDLGLETPTAHEVYYPNISIERLA